MLLDSNILIYAASQALPDIEELVTAEGNAVASVTQIEVYGFAGLALVEQEALNILFRRLTIHPLDDAVIAQTIILRQKIKLSLADAIIAATALVHDVPIVTRNVDDFKKGCRIENHQSFRNKSVTNLRISTFDSKRKS